MWRYIVRRLLWVVVVLLVVTSITYVVFFVMPSTDPAVTFAGKNPTEEQIAEVRHQFGLDKPVPVQYLTFIKNVFLGDQYGWPGLGFSYSTRSPVKDQFFGRVLVTVQLAFGAALIWLAIGIPVGIISAIRSRTFTDRAAMGFALFFVAAPVFWLGLMGLWLFWFKLRWSPGTGYVLGRELHRLAVPHDPALDRAGPAVRRLLRPHGPRQPDRDHGPGLHPHGQGQGADRVGR